MEINKYLALTIIDENNGTLKKYEEKGNLIKYLTKSEIQISDV